MEPNARVLLPVSFAEKVFQRREQFGLKLEPAVRGFPFRDRGDGDAGFIA
jgi:hypothetical protein